MSCPLTCASLTDTSRPEANTTTIEELIDCQTLQPSAVRIMAEKLLVPGQATDVTPKRRDLCNLLLSNLRERHPTIVDSAQVDASGQAIDDGMSPQDPSTSRFVDVYSADVTARVAGVQAMFAISNDPGVREEDRKAAIDAILARLSDEAEPVIAAIHSRPDKLLSVIKHQRSITAGPSSSDVYVDGIRPHFAKSQSDPSIIQHTLRFITEVYLPEQPDVAPEIFEKLLFPALLITRKRHVFKTRNEALISVLEKISPVSGVLQVFQTIWSLSDPNKDDLMTFNVDLSKALAGGSNTSSKASVS